MSKDTTEKRLVEYPDVAADIIDGILYDGRRVVCEEDLRLVSGTGYIVDDTGELRARYRDTLFEDRKNGCRYLFYGIEDQTGVDNTLPLNVIGYDYATYKKQVDEIMDQNRKDGNSAYAKRIHDDQKLVPTVTIVLYYGDEWTGPRSLLDMLDLAGREAIRPYLMDYRINLVELGKDKELYKKFRSDFRLLAQYVSVKHNKQALLDFMKESKTPVRHVEEFLDVMSEIGTHKQYRNIKEKILKREQQEVVTMTTVEEEIWEEIRQDAMAEGMAEGRTQGMAEGMAQGRTQGSELKLISQVCRKLKKGKAAEEIAEELEEEPEVIQGICKIAEQFAPEYDEKKIYENLQVDLV